MSSSSDYRKESSSKSGAQQDGYKVFVYGVHSSCPKTVIEDEFARIGKVNHVYITTKGYAFVSFANLDDAKEAIKELDGANIDGQEVKVELAHCSKDGGGGGPQRRGGHSGGGRGGGGGHRHDGGYSRYNDRGGGGGYDRDRRHSGSRSGGYRSRRDDDY